MFKEYFKKAFSTKTNVEGEYEIDFADPAERFSAFIIDFIITFTITVFLLYPIIKKEIDRAINSYTSNEINIEINNQNENPDNENPANENPDNKNIETSIINVEKQSIDNNLNSENIVDISAKNDNNSITKVIDNQKIEIKKTDKKPTEEEKQEIIKKTLLKNKIFVYFVLFIPIIYNIAFLLSKKQATIGQQIFNLKIIRRNGKKITIFIALDRVLLFTFSKNILISPFSIILPILITKEKTTIYDIFSGTRVIKVKNKIIGNNESNSNNIG